MGITVLLLLLARPSVIAQVDAPSKLYYLCQEPYHTITFYWTDNSTNETGFIIQRSTDGVNWADFKKVNTANNTSAEIFDFDRSVSADFRICATDGTSLSPYSDAVRVVGADAKLEVYKEVPGIRNPETLTIDGITFSELQDQCPAEPEKGKATRISTYFSIEVKNSSGSEFVSTPVYETRPQIRNNLAQNDPSHTSGHNPYHYGEYGPSSTFPGRTLHNKHWTNFDAAENVTLRLTLLDGAPSPQIFDLSDLEVAPEPLSMQKIDDKTLELVLPGASDYSKHYRIAVNKKAWVAQAKRLEGVMESPLFIFINPVHLAPASAPQDEIKEFNDGQLVAIGPGIHLPENRYRFFGNGNNDKCREMYAPGDAYMHYGFIFKNQNFGVKIWGRGIYSDEMFDLYLSSTEYDYSVPGRTPWSTERCCGASGWSISNYYWEARALFLSKHKDGATIDGLTNIGGRMGPVVDNQATMHLINHKDVGYGGGTFQTYETTAYYKGCMLSNDDDITYVHENYSMEYCTSYNMVNGPTFQMGWGKFDKQNIPVAVKNHTLWSSDRKSVSQSGKNHGVFNSRLNLENLRNHNGGLYENFEFYGQENLVFRARIWDEGSVTPNTVSILGDMSFKNFNIRQQSGLKNELLAASNSNLNKKGYIRFFHFDSLTIEGKHVEHIDDGNLFHYDDGVLLHTVTFFSLPDKISEPSGITSMIGKGVAMFSEHRNKFVQVDASLPQSFEPLCANGSLNLKIFKVEDAGDGYIAIKAPNGYYFKADPQRYGYMYTIPDVARGDTDNKGITEEAKFKWVDLGDDNFALWSKAMGLYVRVEDNCGPASPLYAASGSIGENETFTTKNDFQYYSLTVTISGNGTVSPEGSMVSLLAGSDETIRFIPDANHAVVNVNLDGQDLGAIEELVLENVSAHHSVSVEFFPAVEGRVEAENYNDMLGIKTQATSDAGGGENVGFIDADDWMDYLVYVKETGEYFVDFRVASAGKEIQLELKKGDEVLGTLQTPTSGGWQSWKTARMSETVRLSKGKQTIRVYAKGGGWNFNWVDFTLDPSSAGVSDVNDTKELIVYPNPASTRLVFEKDNNMPGQLQLIDLSGKVVFTKLFETNKCVIDVSGYQTGMYFVFFQCGAMCETHKVIVE